MQRLDRALDELSTRGEPRGPDLIIERIERRLAGEPDAVVVASDARRTAVRTDERMTGHESGGRRSRGPLIAIAVFVALVAIVAVVSLLLPSWKTTSGPASGPASEQTIVVEPLALMNELIAALRARDTAAVRALVADEDTVHQIEWLIALDTSSVTLSGCVVEGATISCDSFWGPNFWYNKVHGRNPVVPRTAETHDGRFLYVNWIRPGQDALVHEQFMIWVEETHPGFIDEVAELSPEKAGRLQLELLDQFLASR